MTTQALITELHRAHYRDVVAPLVRVVGSFEAAEEIAQETFVTALYRWGQDGVPDVPLAWLRRVARNRAIDHLRRKTRWQDRARQLAYDAEVHVDEALEPDEVSDDVLRLVFTCCHPALSPEARVALTLHTVCGLTSDEVARAFVIKRTTLQQRLVRAKRKIDAARIPYSVPSASELPERLSGVLQTIYSVFTEGYASTNHVDLVRNELCDEAIRLVRLILELLPESAEARALLALMLLHHARTPARLHEGGLVRLQDQDRTLWDQERIAEALPLVPEVLRARPVPRYAIEAAIAALHARAEHAEDTDWHEIAQLYRVLCTAQPDNPILRLNAAFAVAMAGHVEAGLESLDALEQDGRLSRYHLLYAARAELLRRVGRLPEAKQALEAARSLAANPVERAFLEERLVDLQPS